MNQFWKSTVLIVVVLSLLLFSVITALAQDPVSVDWLTISGGSSSGMAGDISVDASVGQAFVGNDAGFQTGIVVQNAGGANFKVYLPVIVKSN